jgi:hypothetical protein
MKTQEEIGELAERYADGCSTEEKHASYIAFQDGYTQCQEDIKSLLLEIKDSWKGDKLLGGTYEKICNLLNKQD